MKKVLLSLVFVLCFSLTASFAAPSNWAEADVKLAQELNLSTDQLMTDYQKNITREEFSEMIVLLYESLSGKKAELAGVSPFSDTQNSEILKAYNLGIVSGMGGGLFAPNDTITREQIAVMYYRTLQTIDPNLVLGIYPVGFDDKMEISNWAYDAVGFMNAKEILGGVGNNKVDPKGTATREQAIALTVRTYNKFFTGYTEAAQVEKLTSEQIGLLVQSVVKIHVENYDGSLSTGSGFFYGKGKIATNFHVIENASEILIEYEDGTYYDGDIFVTGYNTEFELDLATLSVADLRTPYLELDHLSKLVRGQNIYTIGSPHGLKNSLSNGLISAVRDYEIQITAPISPGSSGGVLLNEYGKVVGITTWVYFEGENLGFAIPINKLVSLDQTKRLTLEAFYSQLNQKPAKPSYAYAEIGSSSAYLQWENTGADYYLVYESENGGEFYEIVDAQGYNEWIWDEGYSLEITGHSNEFDVIYAVAAVKNGVQSDFVYSSPISFNAPLVPSYVVALDVDSSTAILQWEDTGADYYLVYESVNGGEFQELFDSYGYNEWYWYEDYSLEISGYSKGINVVYAVASVKNGVQSDFSYSDPITF
jgi:hypothetical protein